MNVEDLLPSEPIIQLKDKDIAGIREKILEEQNGLCVICGQPCVRACLDHHHIKRIKGTGLVRGVCCSSCNIMIAKSENNCMRYGIKQERLPYILRMIARYLKRKHYPYMHPSEAPPPKKLTKTSFNKLLKAFKKEYPKRKEITFPKSGKLTKELEELFHKLEVPIKFYK